MKLLFLLLVITIIAAFVYYGSLQITNRNKKHQDNRKAIGAAAVTAIILLGLVFFGMYKSATAPDTQCATAHQTTSSAPTTPTSAMDYFLLGNYDYDSGNCQKAITTVVVIV